MKQIKHFVLFLVSVAFVVTFSACGGGGSSTGTVTVTFAGTYVGTETFTVTASGVAPFTDTTPLVVTISTNGNVTVTDVDGTQYTGTVTGDSFAASLSLVGAIVPGFPGVTCNVDWTYFGTVSGDTITGTLAGTFTCTGPGGTVVGDVTGTFSVTLSSGTSLSRNITVSGQKLQQLFKQVSE